MKSPDEGKLANLNEQGSSATNVAKTALYYAAIGIAAPFFRSSSSEKQTQQSSPPPSTKKKGWFS